MADTITAGTFLSVAGTQRERVEKWEINHAVEIHESRPSGTLASPKTAADKDAGLADYTITFDSVDLSFTDYQAYYPLHGTKVAYEARPKNLAVSATNPKLTGNAILELGSVPFEQGGIVRFSATLHCDGKPVLATA